MCDRSSAPGSDVGCERRWRCRRAWPGRPAAGAARRRRPGGRTGGRARRQPCSAATCVRQRRVVEAPPRRRHDVQLGADLVGDEADLALAHQGDDRVLHASRRASATSSTSDSMRGRQLPRHHGSGADAVRVQRGGGARARRRAARRVREPAVVVDQHHGVGVLLGGVLDELPEGRRVRDALSFAVPDPPRAAGSPARRRSRELEEVDAVGGPHRAGPTDAFACLELDQRGGLADVRRRTGRPSRAARSRCRAASPARSCSTV